MSGVTAAETEGTRLKTGQGIFSMYGALSVAGRQDVYLPDTVSVGLNE